SSFESVGHSAPCPYRPCLYVCLIMPLPYDTEPFDLTVGSQHLTLLRVKDLERWVDREALLRDETEEPPYWAHLWTGALTLARYVDERIDCRNLDVLDLGCGLGVTGIIAS